MPISLVRRDVAYISVPYSPIAVTSSAHAAKKTLSIAIIRSELMELSRIAGKLVIVGAGMSGDIPAKSEWSVVAKPTGVFWPRTAIEYDAFFSELWVIGMYPPGGALSRIEVDLMSPTTAMTSNWVLS